MRLILHDYDDENVRKILQALLPRLEGRTLLIMDMVATEVTGNDWLGELAVSTMDLQMMSMVGGSERTELQWCGLIKSAHPHLHVRDIRTPKGSQLSVLEVELDSPGRAGL